MASFTACRLVISVMLLFIAAAPVAAADPKVPPGRDPGGVAVAIIGSGLDYRKADVAARLARDGEGELVGWDFVDEDRTPFAAEGGVDPVVAIVLVGSDARLVPVRVSAGSERQVAQALRLLDETPARVALLVADPGNPIAWSNLATAARQLTRLLIVVPARLVARDARRTPARDDVAGLLVVSAAASRPGADLAVEADTGQANADAIAAGKTHADDVAAAEIAGLAARLIAKETTETGDAMRTRLLGLATQRPDGSKVISGIDRLP